MAIFNCVLRRAKDNTLATRLRHSKKIENLADRQVRPPRKMDRKAVKELDDIKLQGWMDELLSVGPKNRERDKFNDVCFLADIYIVFFISTEEA